MERNEDSSMPIYDVKERGRKKAELRPSTEENESAGLPRSSPLDWRSQLLHTEKMVALRDSQNKLDNLFLKPLVNSSLPKGGESAQLAASWKGSLTCSNPKCQQSAWCGCSKGTFVYGKSEARPFDLNVSNNEGLSLDAPTEEKNLGSLEASTQACPPHGHLVSHKLNSGFTLREMGSSTVCPTAIANDSREMFVQHWKQRFARLQAFLNQCDEGNCEDYIHALRSLSAVGRRRYASQLEKRAIHLLLEEGRELHRMKTLNILGKLQAYSEK